MADLMSSAGAYVSRLWKRDPDYVRVCLLGPGNAGKTTLLYRLVLGETVTTIPTMGLYSETLHIPSRDINFQIWDLAGGCSWLPPWVFKELINPDVICLFAIDSSTGFDIEWVMNELEHVTRNIDQAKHFAVIFNHKNNASQNEAPALKEAVNKYINRLRGTSGIVYEVYDDLVGLNFATGTQVDALLERLIHVAKTETPALRNRPVTKTIKAPSRSRPSREELLKRIDEQSKGSVRWLSPDQFMEQMVKGTLDTWDHICHLRAGFLCLMESILEEHVTFAAADLFLQRLDAMLKAKPGKFRNTFHRTLTVFWMHQIYLQMLLYRQKTGILPTYFKFIDFLRQHPDLMNGRAWEEYWSRDVLFGPEAREAWTLPDLKPLPQFISYVQAKDGLGDSVCFLEGNTRLYQRFAYSIVKAARATDQRRAAIINDTLPMIESYIVQLRARLMPLVDMEPYSLTHAYFWIQMIHAAVASVPSGGSVDITQLSFEAFEALFPELLGTDQLWTGYYTSEQWNSIEARIKTILPKKKPLPNVFPSPSQTQMNKAIDSRLDEKYSGQDSHTTDGRPSPEELFLKVQWTLKSIAAMNPSLDTYDGSMDSHAALLRRLFGCLVRTDRAKTRGIPVSQVLWEELSYFHGKGQYTCAVFWSRMVLGAFARMDEAFRKQVAEYQSLMEITEIEAAETKLFSRFLSASVELCWERLWKVYYSDEVWKSQDAAVGYVPPDKRDTPSYIEDRVI